MIKHHDLMAVITAWTFTIIGFAEKILPLLQVASAFLASVVSVVVIYKNLFKNEKHKPQK